MTTAGKSAEELKRLNGNGKVAIHICLKDSRVTCFISLGNWHLNPCGTEGDDWCYGSPKSIPLWSEGRGNEVGWIIKKAKFLAKMLGIKVVNELGI
jgi:hypothetical protein